VFYVGSSFTAMSFALKGLLLSEETLDNENPYVYGLDCVIQMGGDTDTNACIYGAMAGAFYGIDGLPEKLITKLSYSQFIQQVAISLTYNKDMITDVMSFNPQYLGRYDYIAPLHKLVKIDRSNLRNTDMKLWYYVNASNSDDEI